MYGQQIQEDLFFMMLYGATATLSLTASCYLLFRRTNAFAPDITSSVRLRRWTAAFLPQLPCATCGICRCSISPQAMR